MNDEKFPNNPWTEYAARKFLYWDCISKEVLIVFLKDGINTTPEEIQKFANSEAYAKIKEDPQGAANIIGAESKISSISKGQEKGKQYVKAIPGVGEFNGSRDNVVDMFDYKNSTTDEQSQDSNGSRGNVVNMFDYKNSKTNEQPKKENGKSYKTAA